MLVIMAWIYLVLGTLSIGIMLEKRYDEESKTYSFVNLMVTFTLTFLVAIALYLH